MSCQLYGGQIMKEKQSIEANAAKPKPPTRLSSQKPSIKGWKRPRKMIILKSGKSALDYLIEERNYK